MLGRLLMEVREKLREQEPKHIGIESE